MKGHSSKARRQRDGDIVYHTMIIGEAAYNLTKAFCKAHPGYDTDEICKITGLPSEEIERL